ncbi:hypothetical protein CLAIMM_14968 [Cladophialophora immunda]|nr:hypothetical protein CLAIMM_14968 [Cladophialophora immunda]
MLGREIETHRKRAVDTADSTSRQYSRTKHPKYYAPFCTKWPVLTSILIALLVCVAVLEVGLQVGLTLEEKHEEHARRLRRQVEDPSSSSITQTAVASLSTTTTERTPTTTTATIKTLTPTTVSYLTTTDGTWADWTSDYMISNTTSSKPTSTIATELVEGATAITAFITPSNTGADEVSPAIAGGGSTSSPFYASVCSIYVLNPSTATMISPSGLNYMRTTQPAPPPGPAAPRDSTEDSLTSLYFVMIASQAVTDLNGQVSTFVATITSYPPASTVLGPPRSSVPPLTLTPDYQQSDEVELGLTTTGLQYFRAIYLPTVVAVLSKLVWSVVFASTKMMEPFYLLSGEAGASAKDSLVADYLISTLSINGMRNLFAGHPVIILASLVYICISILPALATQSTTIRAVGICDSVTGSQAHCHPMWELNITYARVLQGVLSATALLILAMMILSARRQSGVFSNPSSIATMASLLGNDEFISEIRKLPQNSNRSAIRSAFGPDKFILAQYPTTSGHVRYGIVKTTDASAHPRLNKDQQQQYPALSNPSAHRPFPPKDRSPLSTSFLIDAIFLLAILALLCITVAYYLTHGDNAFNNFFNNHPLRTFVLTLAASVLDGRWKQLEHEVRLLTPYRQLFRGSAKPDTTILVTQNATAITSFVPALWRGNFFHAFIAFVATLSDVLIIVIGGVPYSTAQFRMDFVVCTYTSWGILAVMALTVLALFRWRAVNEMMTIPHDPNTLVAVWQMLCNKGNGLCEEMLGSETMQGSARDERVKLSGARYWAGWITEPDGSRRWVVEKEKPSRTASGGI